MCMKKLVAEKDICLYVITPGIRSIQGVFSFFFLRVFVCVNISFSSKISQQLLDLGF